jgi:hypothetical protein
MFKKISLKHEQFRHELISEEKFVQTLESYFGMLKHCDGWKIKEAIQVCSSL